ncbi:flap endonuclease-1 [Coprinopsis cinerea AmutBmut pab1-1]|nr:flap endonuclease-1 [Coprinopsis cinerea AmutBmut pab1-1]
MGVHGLLPFLRKSCPQAIRPLKRRFKDISGSRVVIDGTLITQRLHFAPAPHPYRHVLGWYRICQELSKGKIQPWVVFDGRKRHIAKAREVQRRRADQNQLFNRSQVESERVKRLEFVNSFLEKLRELPHGKAEEISKVFPSLQIVSEDAKFKKAYDTLSSQASSTALEQVSQLEPGVSRAYIPTLQPLDATTESVDALSTTLYNVFENFRTSVTLLASRMFASVPPAAQKDPEASTEQDWMLTKAQSQLSVMERDLWFQMSSLSLDAVHQDPDHFKDIVARSSLLLDKSCKMSVSFKRRCNLPNTDTYNESKDIIRAMGVPIIDAPLETEGEGLASSIVLHGDADFVVSEDTDVLVYGAPLLRNLTSMHEPLEIICSQTIRQCLELDPVSFLDFALLLGTDFTQRIKNVGPARALQFVKRYGSIENAIQAEPKYPPRIPPREYLAEVNDARDLFKNLPHSPNLRLIEQPGRSDSAIAEVMTRYRLGRHLMKSPHWAYEDALAGNFFNDNPIAI